MPLTYQSFALARSLGVASSEEDLTQADATALQSLRPIRDLVAFCVPFLFTFGVTSSLASGWVLFKMSKHLLPSCIYLAVAASLDCVIFVFICFSDWLQVTFNFHPPYIAMLDNQSLCKLYPFLTNLSLHMTTWLFVACVVETGLVYLRPDRIHKICTIERARAVILLMMALLIGVNTHSFWSYDVIEIDDSVTSDESSSSAGSAGGGEGEGGTKLQICMIARQGTSEKFIKIVLPLLNVLLADLLPIFIVLSLTVITLARWRHLSRDVVRRSSLNQSTMRSKRSQKFPTRHYKLSFAKDSNYSAVRALHGALALVSCCFILLALPKCVYDIFNFLVDPAQLAVVETSHETKRKLLGAKTISFLLLYLFMVIKGLVFLLLPSVCRQQFLATFACCLRNKKQTRNCSQSASCVTSETNSFHVTSSSNGLRRERSLTSLPERELLLQDTPSRVTTFSRQSVEHQSQLDERNFATPDTIPDSNRDTVTSRHYHDHADVTTLTSKSLSRHDVGLRHCDAAMFDARRSTSEHAQIGKYSVTTV